MSETKTYLFHEISSYLPLLEGEEFDALVEDMREFGQMEPATLLDGKILDGRNRYRACSILGIELITREWKPSKATGSTPLQYVISENIMRRHLNEKQKAEIGMLLYDEVEEKVEKERSKKSGETRKEMVKKGELEYVDGVPKLTKKKISSERDSKIEDTTAYKIAKKVRVKPDTIQKVRTITKIAEDNIKIAEEWEKTKKEDLSLEKIYQKARIVKLIAELPKTQQSKILEKFNKGEATPEQLKQEIQDLKDNITRAEIAKRNRATRKKKEEMEKLHLKIVGLNKRSYELDDAFKSSKARLVVLSKETINKYSHLKSDDPAYVLTHLGEYYDTFDMEIYDAKLKELRNEYDILEKPLRDKLAILEGEYKTKRDVIDKQKVSKNKEVSWIEKQQDLMTGEYDKQEIFKGSIEKLKKEVKVLQEKYDNG